jgi:hypothetical protein
MLAGLGGLGLDLSAGEDTGETDVSGASGGNPVDGKMVNFVRFNADEPEPSSPKVSGNKRGTVRFGSPDPGSKFKSLVKRATVKFAIEEPKKEKKEDSRFKRDPQKARMKSMVVGDRKKRAFNTMVAPKTVDFNKFGENKAISDDANDGLGEFAVFDADGDGDIDKDDLALLSEGDRRNLYLAMPERRHTSHRGKTILMKKPDLMLTLRAYYGYGEEDNEDGDTALENPEMYTNAAILTREALRFDPGILGLLDILWDVTDDNRNGTVQKEEYVTMSTKLFYVVTGDDDQEEARVTALEEWEHDHFGYGFLNKQRFRQSWFQLTDLWTDGLSVEEYMKFLEDIIECLTEVDKKGRRRWRKHKMVLTLEEHRKRRKKKSSDPGYSRKLWEPKERREKVKIKDADSWKSGGGKFAEDHPRWEGGCDDVMAKMRAFLGSDDKEMKAAVTRITMRHKVRGAAVVAANPFAFLTKGSRREPRKGIALGTGSMLFDGEDKTPVIPPELTFDAPPPDVSEPIVRKYVMPAEDDGGGNKKPSAEDDWGKFLDEHRREKQRLKEELKKEMLTLLKSEKGSIRAHREAEQKLAEMKWKRHEMMLKMRAEMEGKKDRIVMDVEHVRDEGGLSIEGDLLHAGDKGYATQRAARANLYAERHRSKGRGEMVAGAMGNLITDLEIEGDSVFDDDSLSGEIQRREMLERRKKEKERRMKAREAGEEFEEEEWEDFEEAEYDFDNDVDYDSLLAQMEADQAARSRGDVSYRDDDDDDDFKRLLDELIKQGADKPGWSREFRLLLEPPTLDQVNGTTSHPADTHENEAWGPHAPPPAGNFNHFSFVKLTKEEMRAQLSSGGVLKGSRLTVVGGNVPEYRKGGKVAMLEGLGEEEEGGEEGGGVDGAGGKGDAGAGGLGHSQSSVGIGMGSSFGYGHYGVGNLGVESNGSLLDPFGRVSRSAPHLAGNAFWSARFDLRSQLGEEYGIDFHNGAQNVQHALGLSGRRSSLLNASSGGSNTLRPISGGLGSAATARMYATGSVLGYGGAPLTKQREYRERARALREEPAKRPYYSLIHDLNTPDASLLLTSGGRCGSRGSGRNLPGRGAGAGQLQHMLFGEGLHHAQAGGSRNFGGKGPYRMVLAEGDGNNQEAEIEEETEKIVVVGAIRKEDEGSEMDGPAPPPKSKWQRQHIPEVVDISENWSNSWLRRSQLTALPPAPTDGTKRRHPKQTTLDSLRGTRTNYHVEYGPEPVNKVGL